MDEQSNIPEISVSHDALNAFRNATSTSGDCVYLSVNSEYHANLTIGASETGLVEFEREGVVFLMDSDSLARAKGLSIDYKSGPMSGFSIDNPNAPAKVVEIEAKELKARLDSCEFVQFFDVRTPEERELALISGTRILDDAAVSHIESLDRGTPLVFH